MNELGVSAFVPKAVSRSSSSSLMMAMSKSVPFLSVPPATVGLPGSKEFDPIGFSDSLDIRWLQEAGTIFLTVSFILSTA